MVTLKTFSTVTLAALIGALACNTLLGIESPNIVDGEGCLLNSDCTQSAHVCLFKTCSPPCEEDKDCSEGARCLETEVGTACVRAVDASCEGAETNECPDGTTCANGSCRVACEDDE